MKIAVYSDSHGEINNIARSISEYAPDMVVHLGDYSRDAHALSEMFPRIPFKIVRGNCDYASFDRESDVFFCGSVKVFITHGHLYSVKAGLSELYAAGLSINADLVLYGHTHVQRYETVDDNGGNAAMHVLNPGTAGYRGKSGWALIEIGESIHCRLMTFS